MDSGALESVIADLAVNPDLAPQFGIEFTPEVRRAIEDYRKRHPGLALGQASKGVLAAARSGFTADSSIGPTDPAALKPPEPPAAPPSKPAAGPYKADAKVLLPPLLFSLTHTHTFFLFLKLFFVSNFNSIGSCKLLVD